MYNRLGDEMRDRVRQVALCIAVTLIAGPLIAAMRGYEHWVLTMVLVPVGLALLVWLRPGRPRRRHVAWVARVEPPPDEVARGRSFDPFYVPTCACGWEDPYYVDEREARGAAQKHAATVEAGCRRTFEPVED